LKKIVFRALIIVISSFLFGLGVNLSLVGRYFGGEFKQSFFERDNYPGIAFISLAETEDLFVSRGALFIDSRSPEEYSAGHILGAVSVPYDRKRRSLTPADLGVPPDKTVVVYCHGGDCQMSVNLAKVFSTSGFKNIKIYTGGWAEWEAARLPQEK
jgi:rhodanese-related sulfurtransferase